MTDEVRCPHCDRIVPAGRYCGACGLPLQEETPAGTRLHAFAGNPAEHVLHPSVATTLFPRISHRDSVRFRLALLALTAMLLIFGYLRLTGPSVAIASAAVPLLYIAYLFEVDEYAAEPVYAIGVTFGTGIVLGLIWALLTGRFITQTVVLNSTLQGASTWRILVIAIGFPLLAQALMTVGALILYFTRPYNDVLDGFTAGAASALGFGLAVTLIHLFPEVQSGPISVSADVSSAIRTVLHGLLLPLIYAGLTGLITAVLWLHRGPIRTLARHGWTISLPLAVVAAAVIQVGLGFAALYVVRTSTAILIYGGVTLLLMLWIRFALHHMFLAEAVYSGVGPDVRCHHCGHMVPGMAFCPNCGGAMRAGPKPNGIVAPGQ